MLRDIPRIYMMFFSFGLVLMFALGSYTTAFIRGGDTLALNDIALTSAVSEIDQLSRIKEGTLVLEDTFEVRAWKHLTDKYPDDSVIQFDYLFDQSVGNFHGKSVPKSLSSQPYVVGSSTKPDERVGEHFQDRPVKAIRVKVREAGDKVTANGTGWTYTSTVKLDIGRNE